MKKGLLFALAMVLAICVGIGGTLAYLFVETQQVINTFEYGDIDISLEETGTTPTVDGNDTKTYKMIPGNTLPKDPKVTVLKDSEACWLFVKVEESANFDEFMTYAIADGWTLYNTDATGSGIDTATQEAYVIYRAVTAEDAKNGIGYNIIAGDTSNPNGIVTVKTTVTKQMMNSLNANGANNYPTLKFTAYAVQSANLTLEQAYGVAFPTT